MGYPSGASFLEPTWVHLGLFWRAFGIIFGRRRFGGAVGLIRASAVAGSPLCGALDIYIYICTHNTWAPMGPHGPQHGEKATNIPSKSILFNS